MSKQKLTLTSQEMIEMFSNTINQAQSIMDGLKDGERIKISDLAEKIAPQVGIDSDEIMPFTTFFAHHAVNVETARGRNGGAYKGTKPAPATKQNDNDDTDNDNTDTE